MLDSNCVNNLVRLDGYYIYQSLGNSSPYLESRIKYVFAMIRQLGLPTWFMSLSSADTKWTDLLNILSQINCSKPLSEQDIDNMSWVEVTKLVKKDPITCVWYFDNRVQEFINTVRKNPHDPIGKVLHYFYRVEFQQRGSPHIHMLIWIENAPHYKTANETESIDFIDKYVTSEKMITIHLLNCRYISIQNHAKRKKKQFAGLDFQFHQ